LARGNECRALPYDISFFFSEKEKASRTGRGGR
jgi:hypothetical protein